ncbi:hypothetical protein BLNAU_13961 [Blattamonas nauphoetae]|uniref:B30.2/SPRY domain-containing protein n=1 Tax=Blattamonas nauphoetae TaxID=2049346 RepID=A0ABQ9XF87_9EUKA|nr:hypothetical protein BLNAU_13961 [Blattamonas nauphoetae]
MFKAATLSDAAPFDNIPTNSSNRSSTSAEEKSNNVEGPHGWDVDMLHLESNMTIFAYIHLLPIPFITLPPMNFTDPSHFSIVHTTIVHAIDDSNGNSFWSSVLLSNPFTSGVVSITMTLLSKRYGNVVVGLMDSASPIPKTDETLGSDVKSPFFSDLIFSDSVGLNRSGDLCFNTPSLYSCEDSHHELKEGDCVGMEVDLDSTPQTVQFFVNGVAGECYMTGIPSSVRIGFTVYGVGTSFRIDNISHLSQPIPISEGMNE